MNKVALVLIGLAMLLADAGVRCEATPVPAQTQAAGSMARRISTSGGSTPRGRRTRFESIAERKIHQRQLTDDGNVEINGRDLR